MVYQNRKTKNVFRWIPRALHSLSDLIFMSSYADLTLSDPKTSEFQMHECMQYIRQAHLMHLKYIFLLKPKNLVRVDTVIHKVRKCSRLICRHLFDEQKCHELKIVMKMHSEQGEITVHSSFVILNVTPSQGVTRFPFLVLRVFLLKN